MVASYVQLLERRYMGRLDADAHEFIAFAVDGARRMQALIDDLLTVSRVDTKGRPLRRLELGEALEAALRSLRICIDERQAEVRAGPLPAVLGDAAQLTQVFQNLVSNAVKFCRGGPPRIEVSAERDGALWRVRVRDNGIGVPDEYRERIFGMFQRLHGRREYAGTGIGLAICQKIVERHGGAIWVEAAAGGGSVFIFTLQAGAEAGA